MERGSTTASSATKGRDIQPHPDILDYICGVKSESVLGNGVLKRLMTQFYLTDGRHYLDAMTKKDAAVRSHVDPFIHFAERKLSKTIRIWAKPKGEPTPTKETWEETLLENITGESTLKKKRLSWPMRGAAHAARQVIEKGQFQSIGERPAKQRSSSTDEDDSKHTVGDALMQLEFPKTQVTNKDLDTERCMAAAAAFHASSPRSEQETKMDEHGGGTEEMEEGGEESLYPDIGAMRLTAAVMDEGALEEIQGICESFDTTVTLGTALHIACMVPTRRDVMEYLMDKLLSQAGSNNCMSLDQWSVLHAACHYGVLPNDSFDLILSHTARPSGDSASLMQSTPLHLAMIGLRSRDRFDQLHWVQVLLEAYPQAVVETDNNGRSPLQIAREMRIADEVQKLLEDGEARHADKSSAVEGATQAPDPTDVPLVNDQPACILGVVETDNHGRSPPQIAQSQAGPWRIADDVQKLLEDGEARHAVQPNAAEGATPALEPTEVPLVNDQHHCNAGDEPTLTLSREQADSEASSRHGGSVAFKIETTNHSLSPEAILDSFEKSTRVEPEEGRVFRRRIFLLDEDIC